MADFVLVRVFTLFCSIGDAVLVVVPITVLLPTSNKDLKYENACGTLGFLQ